MADDKDRFQISQWILERQINWIATADVKAGAVVAVQTAMAGVLASAYSAATNRTEWAIACTVAAFACTVAAFACIVLALFPRTDGPDRSLLFFGRIGKFSRENYCDEIKSSNYTELLVDCSEQIHRNAEIASEKHRWVQNALVWSFLAAPPWVIALLQLTPMKVS